MPGMFKVVAGGLILGVAVPEFCRTGRSLGLPGAVEGLLASGVLTEGEDPFCETGLCMLRFCRARPRAVVDGGGARRPSE